MAADRTYAEFYDFYSISPEYFVYHHTGGRASDIHKEMFVCVPEPV
jgi:hypothetical protein